MRRRGPTVAEVTLQRDHRFLDIDRLLGFTKAHPVGDPEVGALVAVRHAHPATRDHVAADTT